MYYLTIQSLYHAQHPPQSVYPYQVVPVCRTGECTTHLFKIVQPVIFDTFPYVVNLFLQYLFQPFHVLAWQVLVITNIKYDALLTR